MKNSFLFHGNDAGSVRAILHPQPHAAPSPPPSPRSPRSTRRDSRANNTRGAGRMMSDGGGRAIEHGSFRHANRPPEAGLMPAATAGKHLRLRPPRPRLPQVAGGPPAQAEPEPIMSGTTRSPQQARIELPAREAAAQGGSSTRCNRRRLPSPLPPFAPAPSGPGERPAPSWHDLDAGDRQASTSTHWSRLMDAVAPPLPPLSIAAIKRSCNQHAHAQRSG